MAAPRKYPDELRERAIRMAADARRDPATPSGAVRRVGEQPGINPETPAGLEQRGGASDAELEREDEILRTASAFFASAELDRRLK